MAEEKCWRCLQPESKCQMKCKGVSVFFDFANVKFCMKCGIETVEYRRLTGYSEKDGCPAYMVYTKCPAIKWWKPWTWDSHHDSGQSRAMYF